MTQNFMYKRVNIFLLVLMCLIVVGLAGSAIYFQESFKELTSNYDSLVSNYTVCTDVLSVKEERLGACVEDLNSTAGDIGKYDILYERNVEQLQNTQEDLEDTDKKLKETLVELRAAENQFEQEQSRSLDLERQLEYLRQEIINLEARVQNLNNQLDACEAAS